MHLPAHNHPAEAAKAEGIELKQTYAKAPSWADCTARSHAR
jgi:hypothetical protein